MSNSNPTNSGTINAAAGELHHALLGASLAAHGVYDPTSRQALAQRLATLSQWWADGNITTKTYLDAVKDIAGGI